MRPCSSTDRRIRRNRSILSAAFGRYLEACAYYAVLMPTNPLERIGRIRRPRLDAIGNNRRAGTAPWTHNPPAPRCSASRPTASGATAPVARAGSDNLQVNLLKQLLPEGAQIGTVDKFQGQEAAIVIVSMTTSRGTEAPRGMEFLFNPNRFNVAVSRAECLAIFVHGAELLEGAWTKIEDLRRLNLFAHAEAIALRANQK
jgi:AAA domain